MPQIQWSKCPSAPPPNAHVFHPHPQAISISCGASAVVYRPIVIFNIIISPLKFVARWCR